MFINTYVLWGVWFIAVSPTHHTCCVGKIDWHVDTSSYLWCVTMRAGTKVYNQFSRAMALLSSKEALFHQMYRLLNCDVTWAPWRLKSLASRICSTACSRWQHQSPTLLTLCDGNPSVTGGFPSQRNSNVESISMSWRHQFCAGHPGLTGQVLHHQHASRSRRASRSLRPDNGPPVHTEQAIQGR